MAQPAEVDASVDLVHFTILRPPEKQDGTPISELSLIAFPTRELFVQKIKDFDLIIFDRYANQSVLPSAYFDNIVRYVREGGALLIAAGPEFAGPASLARTRSRRCCRRSVDEGGRAAVQGHAHRYRPAPSGHPRAARLRLEPAGWGDWLRIVSAQTRAGVQPIMSGANACRCWRSHARTRAASP